MTAFIGKNDIGKSTVLEALDIFFNESKGVIKIDKEDINKQAIAENDTEVVFSVCFFVPPGSFAKDPGITKQMNDLAVGEGFAQSTAQHQQRRKATKFISYPAPASDFFSPTCLQNKKQ